MTVRVVTDSTADIPPEIAAELGIDVVPLNVHFGTDTYRDNIDLSADEFYQRLVSSPRPPTTSQPSVGAFLEVYQKALGEADGIVSVHISAKLSGTWNSAVQAREQLDDSSRVQVVDTQQASMGLGWVAVTAAKAAQAGASLDEVASAAKSACEQVRVIFLVDTLEYLQKGGRIGKAQAMFGSVLAIKPLLTLQDGEVHPMERGPHSRQGRCPPRAARPGGGPPCRAWPSSTPPRRTRPMRWPSVCGPACPAAR